VEYSQSVDVYAFAMCMYEMLCHQPPWEEQCNMDDGIHNTYAMVASGQRPEVPFAAERDAPSGWMSLMQSCWDHESAKRPSFEVINNPELWRSMGLDSSEQDSPSSRDSEPRFSDPISDPRRPTVVEAVKAWFVPASAAEVPFGPRRRTTAGTSMSGSGLRDSLIHPLRESIVRERSGSAGASLSGSLQEPLLLMEAPSSHHTTVFEM